MRKVADTYRFIFNEAPTSFAAPGWQAGWGTWRAMGKMELLYHSDTRGDTPYFGTGAPAGVSCKTLEIPTTLPTWDEMLAWDGMTRKALVDETWNRLHAGRLNVWTLHA